MGFSHNQKEQRYLHREARTSSVRNALIRPRHLYINSVCCHIGAVTSGIPSPTLQKNIAMAYVQTGFHKKGTEIEVDVRNKLRKAVVTPMPFVKPKYWRGWTIYRRKWLSECGLVWQRPSSDLGPNAYTGRNGLVTTTFSNHDDGRKSWCST